MAERAAAERAAGGGASPARGEGMRAALALAIAIGGGALVFAILPPIAHGLGLATDLGYSLAGNLLWLLLALLGALVLRAPLRPGLAPRRLLALPIAIGGFAAALLLVGLAGGTVRVPAPLPQPGGFLLGSIGIAFGALAEETLFRGFLQPVLVRAWGPAIGIAAAAAGFVIVHMTGGWRAPLTLLAIALAGLWFGLLAWRTGGIAAPFLAHAGWNWAEALLFGALPNPGRDPAGALVDVELVGAGWLGGSGDGMNSALPTMIILALLIAPLLRRRGAPAAPPPPPGIERAALPELRP